MHFMSFKLTLTALLMQLYTHLDGIYEWFHSFSQWTSAVDDFHHGWLFGEALENKDITKSDPNYTWQKICMKTQSPASFSRSSHWVVQLKEGENKLIEHSVQSSPLMSPNNKPEWLKIRPTPWIMHIFHTSSGWASSFTTWYNYRGYRSDKHSREAN